jgi:hypothetical protein
MTSSNGTYVILEFEPSGFYEAVDHQDSSTRITMDVWQGSTLFFVFMVDADLRDR